MIRGVWAKKKGGKGEKEPSVPVFGSGAMLPSLPVVGLAAMLQIVNSMGHAHAKMMQDIADVFQCASS